MEPRLIPVALCALAMLAGCAAGPRPAASDRAVSPRSERIDWELVAAVERQALARGTSVTWVRYPERTRYGEGRRRK